MRRVVVTGLGLVTPLGGDCRDDVGKPHRRDKAGRGSITGRRVPYLPLLEPEECTIACEVKGKDHLRLGFRIPTLRVDQQGVMLYKWIPS